MLTRSRLRRLLVTAAVGASAALATPLVPAHAGDVTTASTPPLVYAALGDSFTSAPLVSAPTGDPIDCGRSTRNYPRLVAAALQPARFRDISCGSAETEHLSEPQDGLPLGGTNPPQFSALSPDTTLVTVGIGGNDIGFGGIVTDCVQFLPAGLGGQPCTPRLAANGVDEVSQRIAAAATAVGAALEQIHVRAPAARVFLVGYPSIVPHTGRGCWPYVPVLPEDVPYLRLKTIELNAMLASQAAQHGAIFVDTYTPSVGHDACQPPGIAWVNGLVVVPPSFPAHPNQLGTAGMAQAVLRAIRADGAT